MEVAYTPLVLWASFLASILQGLKQLLFYAQ